MIEARLVSRDQATRRTAAGWQGKELHLGTNRPEPKQNAACKVQRHALRSNSSMDLQVGGEKKAQAESNGCWETRGRLLLPVPFPACLLSLVGVEDSRRAQTTARWHRVLQCRGGLQARSGDTERPSRASPAATESALIHRSIDRKIYF